MLALPRADRASRRGAGGAGAARHRREHRLSPLRGLAEGGKVALARALAALEAAPDADDTAALLDEAYANPRAHVVGITGPPGVGKSTLVGALIPMWRQTRRSVAVIAVDPSSRRSGGALLGDRTRLRTDPDDAGVFVRSMAARDRLGGLATLTVSAMVVMRALFDIVVLETVGVGQSETDVAGAADTVVLCLQPGAGDTLQFMKAGIVEIPHIIAVTKSDMGDLARRTQGDVAAALAAADGEGEWTVPVLLVSAMAGAAAPLVAEIDRHAVWLDAEERRVAARRAQAERWLEEAVRESFGRRGLERAGALHLAAEESPFRRFRSVAERL